jgi:hypothetical protein
MRGADSLALDSSSETSLVGRLTLFGRGLADHPANIIAKDRPTKPAATPYRRCVKTGVISPQPNTGAGERYVLAQTIKAVL